jgi:hypothetical protein
MSKYGYRAFWKFITPHSGFKEHTVIENETKPMNNENIQPTNSICPYPLHIHFVIKVPSF